jgi:hypothetical protein
VQCLGWCYAGLYAGLLLLLLAQFEDEEEEQDDEVAEIADTDDDEEEEEAGARALQGTSKDDVMDGDEGGEWAGSAVLPFQSPLLSLPLVTGR